MAVTWIWCDNHLTQ